MKKTFTGLAVAAAALALSSLGHAYEVTAVSGGGKVTGKVAFKGNAPEPKKMLVAKDSAICGAGQRELVEVSVKGGNLAGAVVYIAKIEKGKAWGEFDKPMLDQKGCTFTPATLIVRKDADLTIRNSDPVLHNIHTYEIIGNVRRTMFNVGQPEKGEIKQPIKTRRSNAIKVECDAHDFMHAWAFAADNPYVAVTKDDVSFNIDGLPAGEYELKAWHPVLGEKSAKVTVTAGGSTSAAFEYSR